MTEPQSLPLPSAADLGAMPRAADQFLWNDAQKLVAHRNMHHLFPAHTVKAGASVRDLPRQAEDDVLASLARRGADVSRYMEQAEVTGLLAIKRGRIVLERYARGNDDSTVWASRSMAKSITSLMIGAAIQSKHIRSARWTTPSLAPCRKALRGVRYYGRGAVARGRCAPWAELRQKEASACWGNLKGRGDMRLAVVGSTRLDR
jgi:hypothetical protein